MGFCSIQRRMELAVKYLSSPDGEVSRLAKDIAVGRAFENYGM